MSDIAMNTGMIVLYTICSFGLICVGLYIFHKGIADRINNFTKEANESIDKAFEDYSTSITVRIFSRSSIEAYAVSSIIATRNIYVVSSITAKITYNDRPLTTKEKGYTAHECVIKSEPIALNSITNIIDIHMDRYDLEPSKIEVFDNNTSNSILVIARGVIER